PDQLFDLEADCDEQHNIAGRPEHSDLVQTLHEELQARYDLDALEGQVLGSQARRRLVAEALQHGKARHWDFEPDPEQRYVRGDFWGALQFGQIRCLPPPVSTAGGFQAPARFYPGTMVTLEGSG